MEKNTDEHDAPDMASECCLGAPATIDARVSCCNYSTAFVDSQGVLWMFGDNRHGQLGLGHRNDVSIPVRIPSTHLPGRVHSVSMGSVHCLAGCLEGNYTLYSWGSNLSGCLGVGDRRRRLYPVQVCHPPTTATSEPCPMRGVRQFSASVGHHLTAAGTTGGRPGQQEGPSSLAVLETGQVYTWGSCHKGKLGNLSVKSLATSADELWPYRIGSPVRDATSASVNQEYLENTHVVGGVCGALHTCLLTAQGSVLGLGCASTGRLGVRKYDESLHGKRSRMKCYLFSPEPIEEFGLLQRKGSDQESIQILSLSTSRHHMLALGRVKP